MKLKKETTLLDSSLNTATLYKVPMLNSYKKYNIKILDCKDYKQIYIFDNVDKYYKYKGIENDLHKPKRKRDETDPIIDNEILYKNVMRSKIKLQRIAKTNAEVWKTFITLTFDTHITDLSLAYRKFRNFITVLSRHKDEFKWLCVPEFQKSGRVHYHMITNIGLDETNLIEEQVYEGITYYHLKHWKHGFDCVESVKDKDGNDTKKLCGYISKYMTKSYIENCFFNKNRYYCSQNLKQPQEYFVDLKNEKDIELLNSILRNCDIIYSSDYTDNFDNPIHFIEYREIKKH